MSNGNPYVDEYNRLTDLLDECIHKIHSIPPDMSKIQEMRALIVDGRELLEQQHKAEIQSLTFAVEMTP